MKHKAVGETVVVESILADSSKACPRRVSAVSLTIRRAWDAPEGYQQAQGVRFCPSRPGLQQATSRHNSYCSLLSWGCCSLDGSICAGREDTYSNFCK
jgi:hypothetical protein